MTCDSCQHDREFHTGGICAGHIGCMCDGFRNPPPPPLGEIPRINEIQVLHSRTSVPLPMHITTHDNWTGNGWEYQKKWGKTQSEMVEYLAVQCGLYQDEIRRFLRCKSSSVRGRLSEIRSRHKIQIK